MPFADGFELVPDDGPPPMPEDEYLARAAEYDEVLAKATSEASMQNFFEEHPSMLPGANLGYVGHGAWLDAAITQPDLYGLGVRRPDFLWITRNSGMLRPVFVEIESPTKKWVTAGKNPQPTAALTQALNQFRQWREWLARPENHLLFLSNYGVPESWRRRRFAPIYLLIYGRRGENADEIGRIRAEHQREDQHLITYDQVKPRRGDAYYMSMKRDGVGSFRALHLSAATRIWPEDPASWLRVVGRAGMVARNPWISPERKRYLVDDWLPRVDRWAEIHCAVRGLRPQVCVRQR